MSGLEVIGAVAAVVSAFHGGAELVAHIKKKQRRRSSRRRSQQDYTEEQLQDSLETGETQVGLRYTQDLKELGELIRIGDAIARDRLLHIAVVMQAEVIKSLQLAVKHENAVLNLKILHESSILSRQDSIVCLDELKQRILITRPLPRTLSSGLEPSNDPKALLRSFRTAHVTQVPDDYIPIALSSLDDFKNSKPGGSNLSRYFSMKRQQSSTSDPPRPTSSAGSINFSPALNHPLQGSENYRPTIMKDIDEIISSLQGLYTEGDRNHTSAMLHGGLAKRDTLAVLNGGDSHRRDTRGLNQDALMMLKNLPPTPEEMQEQNEYPSFNHRVFDQHLDQQPAFQQYQSAPPISPIPQRTTEPQQPRWSATSASSSVYSDTVPQSLYGHTSVSSTNESPSRHNTTDYSRRESPMSPVITSFVANQHPQVHPNAQYDSQLRAHTPPAVLWGVPQHHPTAPNALYSAPQHTYSPPIAPHSIPQRTHTPPAAPLPLASRPRDRSPPKAPFVESPKPPTPPKDVAPFAAPFSAYTPSVVAPFAAPPQVRAPIEDENGGLRAARTRVHLVPGQLVESNAQYGITTTISTGLPPPTLKDEIYTLARRNKTPSPSRAPASVPLLYHTNSGAGSSISSGTFRGPIIAQENMMDGRPCKENNYWGFCKGAWTIREEIRRGLGVQSVPNGMFNTTQLWQCKSCFFQGEVFSVPHPTKKGKKEVVVDPRVHTSAVGIRYKWIFLAKSHAKKKTLSDTARSAVTFKIEEKEDCNYGCLICSVEGNVTGIYGNIETLMNHIFLEHVRTMSDKTISKTKCIMGRVANADEEWDINIPMSDVLL